MSLVFNWGGSSATSILEAGGATSTIATIIVNTLSAINSFGFRVTKTITNWNSTVNGVQGDGISVNVGQNANQGGYPVGTLQAIAIAYAESAGNNDIKGMLAIASTIKDRINESGTSLNDPNWALHTSYAKNGKSGGSVVGNYNVVNGKGPGGAEYTNVMSLSPDYIAHKSTNAGLKALLYTFSAAGWSGPDYSNPNGLANTGWYYWIKAVDLNAKGSSYNSATMVITIPNLNGTTFFRSR